MLVRLDTMLAVIAIIASTAFSSQAARAEDARAGEVHDIISAQIEAFRQDDGARAYSFASPSLQMLFPTAEAFMSMVRGGYAAVYRPQQFQFGALVPSGDKLIQTVEITAADGTAWTAEYTLARQADGSLKIEACHLAKRPGVGA